MKYKSFCNGTVQSSCIVTPLFVVINVILSVTAISCSPRISCLVIGRPIQSPKQVSALHKVIDGSGPSIIETAAIGLGHTYICANFEELAHFLVQVQPSGSPIETIDLHPSLTVRI